MSEQLKIESRKQLQGELAGLMIAYSRGTDFGLRHDRLTNADYSLLSATEGRDTPDDAACDELIEDLSEFLSGMALPELRSQVRRRMKSWFARFSRTPDDAGFTEALREVGESFDAADMEVYRCDQPEEFCGRCAAWAQAHEDLRALARFSRGNADGWIAVEERLPDAYITVWLAVADYVTRGWRDSDGEWFTEGFEVDGVTHWQPIVKPAPPARAVQPTDKHRKEDK